MIAHRDSSVAAYDLRKLRTQLRSFNPNITDSKAAAAATGSSSSRSIKDSEKIPLSSFAVHDFAPLLALGSRNQQIQLYNIDSGSALDTIKYHIGFLEHRIGAVSALSFHPNRIMLAAGAADSYLSVYSGDLRHQTDDIVVDGFES
eukprot:jgi/Bigna1/74934/fgenesh1_pg.31_\